MTTTTDRDLRGLNFEEGYIAVIDKPLEWTSTDVVRKIKFALHGLGYRRIKVGHAGTLDPLATGILVVCIGRATKRVDALQAEEKEYAAELELGATTPSFDMEHPVDRRYPTDHITREMVGEALDRLTGERLQAPPIYSAKKVEGVRAYEFAARRGGGVAQSVDNRSRNRVGRVRLAAHANPRAMQQGHLHTLAGAGDRRGAAQRSLPHLAAPHPKRRLHGRKRLEIGKFSRKVGRA